MGRPDGWLPAESLAEGIDGRPCPDGAGAARFERVRHLARRLAGIELLDRHRDLLDRRSRRLGIDGEAGLEALLRAAESGDETAGRRLIGLVTTKFTGFFRHPWHFHLASEQALWAAHRRGSARLWSAAAATGEEPWSLAMALIDVFRQDDPPAAILATDIDAEALGVARRGEYGEPALHGLEPAMRARHFSEPAGAGRWRIAPAPRRLVEFREANLVAPAWPDERPFDVILCRNALMYLGADHRIAVARRMASLLVPGGLLLLDPAEHLGPAGELFARTADGVYRLREAPRSRAEGNVP